MYADIPTTARESALEKAVNYVSMGWIPPNKEKLAEIQGRLASGYYNEDHSKLIEDIKSDIALYTLCLRELATVSEVKGQLPHEILENADIDRLRVLLEKKPSDLSSHSVDGMTEAQIGRLKECIISANTANALAPHFSVDSNDGFACSVLRQLGLTLISWNYPRVYAKAIESAIQADDLDTLLHRSLGFSPHTLGVTIAQRWGISDKIINSLQSGKPSSVKRVKNAFGTRPETPGDMSAIFSKICEVGEALARANNPQLYPSAMDDWETASKEIAAKLGKDGVQSILEQSATYARPYSNQQQKDIEPDSSSIKDNIINSRFSAQKIEQNTLIKLCPEEVRSAISKFYYKLKPGPVSKDLLRDLIANVLPKCGFAGGCVYTVDPASGNLVPSIRFGKLVRNTSKPVKTTFNGAGSDLITSSFTLKAPLKEDSTLPSGEHVTMLSGALGNNQRVGVLYLEVVSVTGKVQFDPITVFKAVRQVLADCLNLV